MRHDKLQKELQLLLMLIENHSYTVPDLCERMDISRRNLYYYLEFFRDAGFLVEHHKPYYRIRKDSPFFRKLDAAVHFTEDEAILMRRMLEETGDDSQQVRQLIAKLDKLYDLNIVDSVELREQLARNKSALYEAIKSHRCVVLKGYSSASSNTVRDRLVEPYFFMNGNQEVRCFELDSKQNKTFKLSRIQDVQLLDLLWSYEAQHRRIYTDIFMFSSEKPVTVKLRLGRLAASMLREEYPQAEPFITADGADHWIVELQVCSYLGIGRFVLGLFDDIEVLGDDLFRDYLKMKVSHYNSKTK